MKNTFFYFLVLICFVGCKFEGFDAESSSTKEFGSSQGTACSVTGLQNAECIAGPGSYWSGILGGNINGPSGSLSISVPAGFYSGSTFANASDSNLIASNIVSGVSIFGITGSAGGAYAACSDNTLNNSMCSTAASRYVTATAGSNVTVSGALSASIPIGFQNGTYSCQVSAPSLTASNLKYGVTVLGVTGTYSGLASHMNRTKGSTQISMAQESVQYSGSNTLPAGYRALTSFALDTDASVSGVDRVDRTGWGATTCGTSQSTISDRISDCATVFGASATWNGTTSGISGHGIWKLVARKGNFASSMGKEVWQDQRTGLLWSSKISTAANWCRAAGSHNIAGVLNAEDDPATPTSYCDDITYQNTSGSAISGCYEGTGFISDVSTFPNDDDGKGGLHINTTPAVAWRLPTRNDYYQAEINGIRFVFPETIGQEWTSTIYGNGIGSAWAYSFQFGGASQPTRSTNNNVRCVGR